MIQGLWDFQVNATINLKLGDADVDKYKHNPMTKILARWGKTKKDKHGKHCNDQRKHFLAFVISVERMLDRDALLVLYRLSRVMAEKTE